MMLSSALNTSAIRTGGKDLLSVALMDARNRSLFLLCQVEPLWTSGKYPHDAALSLGIPPPQWIAGRLGWYQERWTARNVQRHVGAGLDLSQPPLPSIDPYADERWGMARVGFTASERQAAVSFESTRAYLLETFELTLGLLEKAADDDAGLHVFRACLCHEDQQAEVWLQHAQMLGLPVQLTAAPTVLPRPPMGLTGTCWRLGSDPGGWVPDNEMPVHSVQLPSFEIDAQPVTWAQFSEFVDDGGYDEPSHWSAQGWAWVTSPDPLNPQDCHRRAPRYVEHMGRASGAVVQTRFGQTTRLNANQSAVHLTWWEADAYARWAGRRLPDEAEWEISAHQAGRQGWRWGDVWEWTANVYRPYPGYQGSVSGAAMDPTENVAFGQGRVARGASFATADRLRHPKARRGLHPDRNDGFIGFRTCAV